MLHIMHHLIVFPKGGLDKVCIKVDMGERRKTLKIWLNWTRDRGGVEGTTLEAKNTKKYPRPKTALSKTDLF